MESVLRAKALMAELLAVAVCNDIVVRPMAIEHATALLPSILRGTWPPPFIMPSQSGGGDDGYNVTLSWTRLCVFCHIDDGAVVIHYTNSIATDPWQHASFALPAQRDAFLLRLGNVLTTNAAPRIP